MKVYKVKRDHFGDKFYSEGDEREADPNLVVHLVKNGVLEEKAAPLNKNKMIKPAKNKRSK